MNPRTLKVEKTGDYFCRKIKPVIRLKGHWLERAGFQPDSRVRIVVRAIGALEVLADGHPSAQELPLPLSP